MKTTLQRIKEYIDSKGVSVHSFEKSVGMSNGSFASQLKNNKTIGVDKLENILSLYTDLNSEWLLTGSGGMLKHPASLKATITEDNVSYLKKFGVPLIPIEAMAGVGGNGDLQIHESEVQDYFIIPQLEGVADCAFSVSGRSMATTYMPGDYVICKRIFLGTDFIQWNRAYVLDTQQGNFIKRIRKSTIADHFRCLSDNIDFDEFEVPTKIIRNLALVLAVVRLD